MRKFGCLLAHVCVRAFMHACMFVCVCVCVCVPMPVCLSVSV